MLGPVLPPAAAREVRVATFNILQGTGEIGSDAYYATRAVLERMDADIVCFQELYTNANYSIWTNLAAELGYPYTAFNENSGVLSGGLYLGYYSRFPIRSTANVRSPPGANELTRLPFRAVIDVPDTQNPLVLWTMHHKSSSGSIDKFRRAIEAYRIVQDIDAYLAANPNHVEYVLTGDMNDDIRDYQTPAQFASQPSGAPAAFVLGTDITYPAAYATFPSHRYANAGNGLIHMPAFWEGTNNPVTRPESSRQLDYVFLSPALMASPLGAPQAEVYYSVTDLGGGLSKVGAPLPPGTSITSSDHLPIFVDLHMADFSSVLPSATFAANGEAGGPFDPEFKTYTVTETNAFPTVWSVATDVAWLSADVDRFALAPLEALEVDVFLNEHAAALPPGVHTGFIHFWNETTDLLETRTAILTIRDHLAVTPIQGFAALGIAGGPFDPATKTYVVTNKSTLAIPFTASATESWLTISPSSWLLPPGESVAVSVGFNANALNLPNGNYAATVVFSNQLTGLVAERPVALAIAYPLCDAVDRCDLTWITGGDAEWFHQTDVSMDGQDAAQSGPITTNQLTWMETTVAGPIRVSFRWKVSSRSSHYLRFYLNGVAQSSVAGEVDWTNRTYELSTGIHTLRWAYATTSLAIQGANAGWVDQVAMDYLIATPATTWSVSGPPGGPFLPATRQVVLTNAGLDTLQWSALPGVTWITVAPAAGELAPGASTLVEFTLNENALVLPTGTHAGSVAFSNLTTGSSFLRNITLTVRDSLVVSPSYSIWFQGFIGGPFYPETSTLNLSNSSLAEISWEVSASTNWAILDVTRGSLAPGGVQNIAVAIGPQAMALSGSWDFAELVFTNLTTGLAQTREIYLILYEPLAVQALAWSPAGPVGGPFAPSSTIFTLTNQSSLAQAWTATARANWLSLDRTGNILSGNAATAITASLNANANTLPMGSHAAAVVFSNSTTGGSITQQVVLSIGVVFCEAIEACNLEWTLGGHAQWLYQTTTTRDGLDAAVSGAITDSQQSWMQTTVTGPGTLSFWWKVSSETNYDYLEFWIDQVRTNRISGEVDWQMQTFVLGPGSHLLQWQYVKDGSVARGTDRGWVDLVAWPPARTAMGVPIAWYQRFGLAPADGQTWDDLDWQPSACSAPNWFQYLAGLDPTNSDDSFQLHAIQQAAGTPVQLEWWGGTNGPASPYVIQSTLDLHHGPWEEIGTSPRVPGVNIWTNPAPADTLRFYRILVPPDPVP